MEYLFVKESVRYNAPVGFKHVATLMITKDIMIGGEESGGIGVKTNRKLVNF